MRTRDARVASIALIAIAGFLVYSCPSRAAEPWVDPALSVTDGLALWLDASVQPAAHRAANLRFPSDTGPTAEWLDGSGRRRHLLQRIAASQPTFHPFPLSDERTLAVLHFDGTDDYLGRDGVGAELSEFTAFIVAAPHANPGFFRCFLAAHAWGQNDYTSGFNIDLGGESSQEFSALNVEGPGFGGTRNLRNKSQPFGTFQVVAVTAGEKDVRVAINGQVEANRPRQAGKLNLDGLTLAARYYSNSGLPAANGSFLAGDFAEVLLYDRALPPDQADAVTSYLTAKYAPLLNARDAAETAAIIASGERPEVQILAPGFRVRRLPLELSNINDLQYDGQGRLFALTYDGRVLVLTDTDRDGLEDASDVWWDEPRLIMPMAMILDGQSAIVAQRGKVSRLIDGNGDGTGDREEVVASDWAPPRNFSGGVDSVGLAQDADGAIYFGLGTSDYANAYLVDAATGESGYDIAGERGTIQRVGRDGVRETVCTGTRFPVGMAFNSRGDLFCSEQEGATWLPNGNPFDELLHIQPGRHYGFPPRHPKHLPDVIDEPSVFDYAPQHQSTCGLAFNLPVNGGASFGPASWRDNALICGYSRGKVYRTQLVSTDAGYVARTSLFAALRSLTLDASIAPDGSLLLVTHSGGPDWGSGPKGEGTLFKVTYDDPDAPQPVAMWPAAPGEYHIAFDRELDPAQLVGLTEGTTLTVGEHVRAGDRYEVQRPGYAVVAQQQTAPRRKLPVHSVQLSPDRQKLILLTDSTTTAEHYAAALPWKSGAAAERDSLPQEPRIELDCSLNGVAAEWTSHDRHATWRGWLPHPDLSVSFALLAGSAEHQQLQGFLATPGTLSLQFQADLHGMLRPAVQPGSQLDFELPPEEVSLLVKADRSFVMVAPDGSGITMDRANSDRTQTLHIGPGHSADEWMQLAIVVETGGAMPALSVSWTTAEDDRPRALPLRRCFVPWAQRSAATTGTTPTIPPELAGGDWERGRQVFHSEEAQCAKCHSVRGVGGKIGADLSNLVHRDVASVTRDILQPNFALNPDYLSYTALLTDGRTLTGAVRADGDTLTGAVRADGDTLIVGDTKGTETRIERSEVESLVPQSVSIMPEGLGKTLGPDRLRDLLTFLLLHSPTMPRDLDGAPPPRTRGEVAAALAGGTQSPPHERPLHITLVAGPKDHGVGEHDYPAWQRAWRTLLSGAQNVTVDTAWEWPSEQQFAESDVMLLFQHGQWNDDRARQIDAYLSRGGGLVYLHWAVDGGEEVAKRIGLASLPTIKFRHGPLQLVFDRDESHPITRNFSRVDFYDESYWQMIGDPAAINTLGTGVEDGEPQPLFWTHQPDGVKGRVFVSILGHYSWTFDDPLFRILVLRGTAWAAGEDVNRLQHLATVGVELRDE